MNDANGNYDELKSLVMSLGACAFGVAEVKKIKDGIFLKPELVDGLGYCVSFAVALSGKILESIIDRPNQLYYFHYQRVNIIIDSISLRLNDFIQKAGYDSLPVPASQVIDWDNQTGHVSHRHAAYGAGIGWRGKNNLIVNPHYGSGIRLGTVLTNLPLVADNPTQNNCAECRVCIDACPAQAIKSNGYDKELCRAKLKEFMRTEKIGQMICGVCVKACPIKTSKK